MRSRYAAYAVGHLDHVFRTWHPRTRPDDLDPPARWSGPAWRSSTSSPAVPTTTSGIVEFAAHYLGPGGAGTLHERSTFERRGGGWVYAAGGQPRRSSPGHVDRQLSRSLCPADQHVDQRRHRAGRDAVRRQTDRSLAGSEGVRRVDRDRDVGDDRAVAVAGERHGRPRRQPGGLGGLPACQAAEAHPLRAPPLPLALAEVPAPLARPVAPGLRLGLAKPGGRAARQQHLEPGRTGPAGERRDGGESPRGETTGADEVAAAGPGDAGDGRGREAPGGRAADTRPSPVGPGRSPRWWSRSASVRAAAWRSRCRGSVPAWTARTMASRATAGSGGIRTRSAPASRARTAGGGPCAARTAAISSESVTTSPPKPSSSRRRPVDHPSRQRGGHAWVDGADVDVADHHRGQPLLDSGAEGDQLDVAQAPPVSGSAPAGSGGCRRAPTRDPGSASAPGPCRPRAAPARRPPRARPRRQGPSRATGSRSSGHPAPTSRRRPGRSRR